MLGICSWGHAIGIDIRELDSLDFSIKCDVDRFSKVLQLWMERKTKPVTWNTILEVIGSPPIQNL